MADHGTLFRLFQRLRRAFGQDATDEQAAALVWRRAGKATVEVLLITSRGTGRWILPKGWIEDGEDMAGAAAREAWEEAGVTGRLAGEAVGTYRYVKVDGSDIRPCEVTVFALALADQADQWPECAERERAWYPAREAAQMVDETELKALLERFEAGWEELAA